MVARPSCRESAIAAADAVASQLADPTPAEQVTARLLRFAASSSERMRSAASTRMRSLVGGSTTVTLVTAGTATDAADSGVARATGTTATTASISAPAQQTRRP